MGNAILVRGIGKKEVKKMRGELDVSVDVHFGPSPYVVWLEL